MCVCVRASVCLSVCLSACVFSWSCRGNFKKGEFDGKCTRDGPVAVRSDTWVKAVGEYKDGKEVGNWTVVFDTGDHLEMPYKNGSIDGWAVHTWANGTQQRTRFEAGQKVEQEERKPAK